MKFIVFTLLLIITVESHSQLAINHKKRWKYLKENFYFDEGFSNNNPVIYFSYSRGTIADVQMPNAKDFHPVNTIEGSYGFMRVKDTYISENIKKHDSEFIFLRNTSSDFKTFDLQGDKILTDAWSFGFGYKDGHIILLDKDDLFLNHTTAITFTNIDFDNLPPVVGAIERASVFDNNLKFGITFRTGIDYMMHDVISINVGYENALVFRDYQFGNWLGMFLFDNLTQRWIDYYELDFISQFGTNLPIMKWIYKSALSFAVYKLRQSNSYYPFNSSSSVSYNNFTIGLRFIF